MIPVSFTARAEPLAPVAIAALNGHTRTLLELMLKLTDAQLHRFSGVAAAHATVILGACDALPWFDGALYLGAQGGLLLPTWAEPSVHPVLLERALRRAMPEAPPGPLAILISTLGAQPLVVPLAKARPLFRERLR